MTKDSFRPCAFEIKKRVCLLNVPFQMFRRGSRSLQRRNQASSPAPSQTRGCHDTPSSRTLTSNRDYGKTQRQLRATTLYSSSVTAALGRALATRRTLLGTRLKADKEARTGWNKTVRVRDAPTQSQLLLRFADAERPYCTATDGGV